MRYLRAQEWATLFEIKNLLSNIWAKQKFFWNKHAISHQFLSTSFLYLFPFHLLDVGWRKVFPYATNNIKQSYFLSRRLLAFFFSSKKFKLFIRMFRTLQSTNKSKPKWISQMFFPNRNTEEKANGYKSYEHFAPTQNANRNRIHKKVVSKNCGQGNLSWIMNKLSNSVETICTANSEFNW